MVPCTAPSAVAPNVWVASLKFINHFRILSYSVLFWLPCCTFGTFGREVPRLVHEIYILVKFRVIFFVLSCIIQKWYETFGETWNLVGEVLTAEWDKQPPEEKVECMFWSWNNTRRRVTQKRGCNIARLWGCFGMNPSCILMLEISIVEFKVQNLNFSKMWLDIHQNVKSRNIRIVRVLKWLLLVIRLEITEN